MAAATDHPNLATTLESNDYLRVCAARHSELTTKLSGHAQNLVAAERAVANVKRKRALNYSTVCSIVKLRKVFRTVDAVSVILRFIVPEHYGILSSRVEHVLGIQPTPTARPASVYPRANSTKSRLDAV